MKKVFFFLFYFCLSKLTASAYTEINGIYYNLDSNTKEATVTSSSSSKYTGTVTIPRNVTIRGITYSVTEIGSSAFSLCSKLTSITIPNSVKVIGSYAFRCCSGLKSIIIPTSVTKISSHAFYECTSLVSITIPDNVTEIGDAAFSNCYSLISVKLGNHVTTIEYDTFLRCYSLTSITIPSSVTSIEGSAFWGCSGLTSISIPNSITSIGESAFYGCTSLSSMIIPNSVTKIGEYAFSDCSNLTSVTIPNSVAIIKECAFRNCSNLTSVHISDVAEWCKIKFEEAQSNPLYYAKHLYINDNEIEDLIIPSGVISIEKSVFYGCSGLRSVTIPNTVTSIGKCAFEECSGLTSITIPNSVKEIGTFAFYECSNLLSVTIPNGVTKIGTDTFYGCSSLTSVTIPNSVIEIGSDAFRRCSGLSSITIPSNVTKIGTSAFSDCSNLKDVYCYARELPSTSILVFSQSNIANATLFVPQASIESYKMTEPWSEFKSIVSLPEVVVDDIAINETNFPDENFRNWVLSQDYGNDGFLTEKEIADVTQISVTEENIQDFKGIEYFTTLKELICWGNELTNLDLSKNTELEYLSCYNNQLTSLDLSKNTKLTSLECNDNQLTSLDISGCTALEYISCYNNQLASLDVSNNTILKSLDCWSNQLTSIDVSRNTKMTGLSCDDNRLTSLDVSKNTALTDLYCYNNQLTSLDVSKNTELTTLYCYQNRIKGAEMDALVNSLPTVSDGEMMVIYNEDEGNLMTATQVAAAKAKGWTPYYTEGKLDEYDDVIWLEYAGSNDVVLHGDVNDDGIVNGTDIQAVINLIVASLYDEKGDVNNDGTVNGTDIQEIINIIVKGDNPDEEKTMLNTPLTLEAIADGTVTFKNVATGIVIYKIDDGEAQTIAAGTTKNIPVNAGQKVTLFGDNVTYYNGANADGNRKSNISGTADFYVYGNIMSLVSSTSYATATTLTGERTFVDLFRGAVKLKNHPSQQLLLPATTLAEDCYNGMFAGCTSLTTAPALPAMSVNGYIGMFEGCTSLMAAPELPATTLGVECYAGMFAGCTSLTTAPALPATTLADYCYSEMFSGCTSLAAAPALPATTLKQGCYQYMFEDCSNLTSIKCLATDMSASSCTYNWLKNVAANGTFVKAASASWTSGKNGIPTGWTVQNEYVPSKFQGPKRVFGNNLLSSFSHSNKRYELTYNSDNFVTKVTEERLEDSGHEGYTYEYEVSYSGEQVTINRTRSDNERVRQYVITIGDNGFAESCTEGYLDSSNKTVIKFEYDSDGHVTKIIEEDDNPYGGTFTWQNGNIIKQNGIGDNRSCNYTYANISNVAGLQIRANIGSMDDYYLPELYYMGLLGMGTANLVQSYSYSNSYSEISTAENVWTLDDAGRPIKCVTTSTSYDGYTGTSNHSWSYR